MCAKPRIFSNTQYGYRRWIHVDPGLSSPDRAPPLAPSSHSPLSFFFFHPGVRSSLVYCSSSCGGGEKESGPADRRADARAEIKFQRSLTTLGCCPG